MTAVFVGIDLAASPRRPTGVCLLRGRRVETKVVYSDDEMFEFIERVTPSTVGVDAPLFLPIGRCCLRNDCACAGASIFVSLTSN
jgi:hypothetical protein